MRSQEKKSLAGISLFDGLSDEVVSKLSSRCRWYEFEQNQQVIDRHSKDRDLYFIAEGRARVVNYSLSGREVSFDDREAGDYFGELSAIDDEPRSTNVVALEHMSVACLAQRDFIDLLSEFPGVTIRILRGLAKIVRVSNNRIMDLSTLGANNRVHAEILRLVRLGITEDNLARISPFPIHSDIASRVSTTRETVNRVFSDLTRKGVLKREKEALIVLDIARLRKMVEQVRGERIAD